MQLSLVEHHVIHLQSKRGFAYNFVCVCRTSTRHDIRSIFHLVLIKRSVAHYITHLVVFLGELFLANSWVIVLIWIIYCFFVCPKCTILRYFRFISSHLGTHVWTIHTSRQVASYCSCFVQVDPSLVNKVVHRLELILFLNKPLKAIILSKPWGVLGLLQLFSESIIMQIISFPGYVKVVWDRFVMWPCTSELLLRISLISEIHCVPLLE